MNRAHALEGLPVAYAVALRLHDAGFEPAAIATALGVDLVSVEPLLRVAEAKAARHPDRRATPTHRPQKGGPTMTATDTPPLPAPIDEAKLMSFVFASAAEAAGAFSAALVVVGDRLGLYKAMAGAGPLTSTELADRTHTAERYIREWLLNQAASGVVTYDPAQRTYTLPAEQAFALADEDSPACLQGLWQVLIDQFAAIPAITEAFRSGQGVGWHEHTDDLFTGVERFFRAGYTANLVAGWIPALDGVEDKLRAGVKVADIGCGHGASTILLAQAYPSSTFVGSDYHPASIERARKAAAAAGVADRATFEIASSTEASGTDFALVCFFDCLHDMGDPVSAARHARSMLSSEGTVMIVEPYAGDTITDNLNPVGRLYSACSTFMCTPAALSQSGGHALGAQSGEPGMRAVAGEAGFTRFRRATETPFNIVYEARP